MKQPSGEVSPGSGGLTKGTNLAAKFLLRVALSDADETKRALGNQPAKKQHKLFCWKETYCITATEWAEESQTGERSSHKGSVAGLCLNTLSSIIL